MRKLLISVLVLLPISSVWAEGPSAADVYNKMTAAVGKHRSVAGKAKLLVMGREMDMSFRLLWPGYYFMDHQQAVLLGTGSKHYMVMPGPKQYMDEGDHYELPTTLLIGLKPLLKEQDPSYKPIGKATATTFQGSKVLAFKMRSSRGPSDDMTIYVKPDTFYPAGASHVSQGKSIPNGLMFITIVYTKLDFNAPLKASDFEWSPPADYKEVDG